MEFNFSFCNSIFFFFSPFFCKSRKVKEKMSQLANFFDLLCFLRHLHAKISHTNSFTKSISIFSRVQRNFLATQTAKFVFYIHLIPHVAFWCGRYWLNLPLKRFFFNFTFQQFSCSLENLGELSKAINSLSNSLFSSLKVKMEIFFLCLSWNINFATPFLILS